MIVWRNGELVDASGAIPADDRGWLIGDAAFETVLVDNGRPAFLGRHLERLARGCAILGIEHAADARAITEAIASLARANAIEGRAACRLTVSRVGGPRGVAPAADARGRLVVSLVQVGAAPFFFRLILSSRRRWTGASTNAFKCAGACAENMLARAEAAAAGADEALMPNELGRVACASAANVFLLTANGIATPPVSEGAMPGVVRGVVIEEARKLGLEVAEAPILPAEAARGGLLLTNSIAGAVRSALDEGAAGEGARTAEKVIAAYQQRLALEFDGQP